MMKNTLKNLFGMTAVLLAGGTASAFAADPVRCPDLTADDVRAVIDNGIISTDQGYTLADEADATRAQVLTNEPTANPFDTYYDMIGKKNIGGQNYFIFAGSILGKGAWEARDRAKQIFLGNEKVFTGKYNAAYKFCLYRETNASASVTGYPFKSLYETAALIAVPYEEGPGMMMRRMMMKKNRSR